MYVKTTGFIVNCLVVAALISPCAAQTAAQAEYFEKKVRPILAGKCQMCHNPKAKTSGLDMSTGMAFFAGGASGSLINLDHPEKSLLLEVTSYEAKLKMPPMGKLKDEEIGILRDWVKMGATWPGADPKAVAAAAADSPSGTRKHGKEFTAQEWNFWAFQPVKGIAPPAVKDKAWVRTSVDAFVLQGLEAKGLRPAPPATREALLRRVTFDMHGLPPSEREIRDFVNDKSADAYEKVVERLLASPRYGEKWGRHWLDVARYADSTGNDEDHRYPYAYRYRDYVIDAFNADLPYNRFVKEQIAGDLLPPPAGESINRRGIVATGFLALGAKAIAQQDKKKMLYDVYDEQLDVTSKAFLGMTLACARCHDHKFDPLTQKDYYGIVGMFASTQSFKDAETHVSKLLFTPLVPRQEYEKYEAAQALVAEKQVDIEIVYDRERERAQDAWLEQLPAYMMAARAARNGNLQPEEVAGQRGLNPRVVKKWVEHFNETEVPRPWLDAFHKAPDADAEGIARGFIEPTKVSFAAFKKKMANYRQRQRKQIAEKNMLSEKPKTINEKDGFFRDVFADGGPFGIADRGVDAVASPEGKKELAALRAEQKKLRDTLPPEPDMACAVADKEPVSQKIFVRGEYTSPGEEAPKTFPLVIAGRNRPVIEKGSGRLELAEWLGSDTNPLTASVMVNRIWHWHFGEGIVRTPDNFGKTGERPTHPELLDFLATQFVNDGWSVKKMHRMMLLSNAYRMASTVTTEHSTADPENRLFSRFPRRRLEVEEIRDALLAISGKLDFEMGGTMQKGFGTDGENSSGRMSINPETQVRRSVYLPLRRANLPALLNLFDFGDATTANGRRIATNVAPQALFLMNSQFVAEQAEAAAVQSLAGESLPVAERVNRLYLTILNRTATPAEIDNGLSYTTRFVEKFPKTQSADAWQSLARVLMASNEFMYVD